MSGTEKKTALYKSEEARSRLLGLYEEVLQAWPKGPDGSSLERVRVTTTAGETAVFAFGSRAGGKKPLVLLHGTGSNSSMWLADAAALGAERRVYALDIPGEPGLSAQARMDWQGDGSAYWLTQTIDALGLREHDLLGLSIGGWIALSYAIKRSREVSTCQGALRALALLCPAGIGRTKGSFILKAMLQMPRGRSGIEAIARSLYGDMAPPEGAIRAGTGLSMATNARMESPRIFTDEELAGIEPRLFLAVGEKDVMLHSRESAERLGRIKPQAEIHLLPGAGHALIGQAKLVLDFFDRP